MIFTQLFIVERKLWKSKQNDKSKYQTVSPVTILSVSYKESRDLYTCQKSRYCTACCLSRSNLGGSALLFTDLRFALTYKYGEKRAPLISQHHLLKTTKNWILPTFRKVTFSFENHTASCVFKYIIRRLCGPIDFPVKVHVDWWFWIEKVVIIRSHWQ